MADYIEDNGPEKDIHRCVECVYYKAYNIKKNPCFPEIYFTGYCKIHDTNVNKNENCEVYAWRGLINE